MNGMRICEALWIAFLAAWVIWAIRTKTTRAKEGVWSRLSYTVLTVAAFFSMFTDSASVGWLRARTFPEALWVDILGVAITVTGLGLAIWARAYLGGNWSSSVTAKVGHQLIRSGPYRWVRHPIYSGMTLAMFGTALELRELRGLLAVALLYVGFKIKSRIEERTMVSEFGAEYADYSRRTGAIFPRVRT
jgi:protein-S-isoprenylcysteine O-methyltransferase Ste14